MCRKPMTLIPPPSLVESYWVLPGRLLAGEYPAHLDRPQAEERLDALLALGLDTFFDLTEPGEIQPYLPLLEERAARSGREIRHVRYPIVDFGLPERETMLSLLDAIDSALTAGRNVYLHCWGGVGRTGTAVGCYLVRRGRTPAAALAQIAEWRAGLPSLHYYPRSPQTDEQVAFVQNWREDLPRQAK